MMKLFGKLFARLQPAPSAPNRTQVDVPTLVFRDRTSLPIVEWNALDAYAPQTDDPKVLDDFWTAVAVAWLEKLKLSLGDGYHIHESDRFVLLTSMDPRPSRVLLDYVEKTRRRILMLLENIVRDTEMGKVCILVLRDTDTYYQYVSNYYPDAGEFAQSGGMFLQHGYGHFVFTESEMFQMEPTIAHELTHCLMQHLPLPAWLNEGIAVNTEKRLSPPMGPLLETPAELHQLHLQFWDASTIQEFWSGKSWNRAGDGNKLSYDLATRLVQLVSADRDAFCKFVNSANGADGGAKAADECFGYPIGNLVEAVLGDGEWEPNPAAWKSGIEQGQFCPE